MDGEDIAIGRLDMINVEILFCGSSISFTPENAIAFANKIKQVAYTVQRKAGK